MSASSAGEPVSIFTWNRAADPPQVVEPLGKDFDPAPPAAVRSIRHPEKETEKRAIRSIRMESPSDVVVRDFFFAPAKTCHAFHWYTPPAQAHIFL